MESLLFFPEYYQTLTDVAIKFRPHLIYTSELRLTRRVPGDDPRSSPNRSDTSVYLFQYRPMQPGRSPSWNIIAGLEQSAWLEAVELASDGRLLLPLSLRKRIHWGAPGSSLPLLATIGPDNEVGLQPLSERQDELAALKGVLSDAGPSDRAPLALAAMATYFQISLQPDGRLRLPPGLARHLRTPPGSWIWVAACDNDVALWSDEAWALVMKRRSAALQVAMAKTRLAVGASEAAAAP